MLELILSFNDGTKIGGFCHHTNSCLPFSTKYPDFVTKCFLLCRVAD